MIKIPKILGFSKLRRKKFYIIICQSIFQGNSRIPLSFQNREVLKKHCLDIILCMLLVSYLQGILMPRIHNVHTLLMKTLTSECQQFGEAFDTVNIQCVHYIPSTSICLLLRLKCILEAKTWGKIYLMLGHFDIRLSWISVRVRIHYFLMEYVEYLHKYVENTCINE